jgi:hypothetical protein
MLLKSRAIRKGKPIQHIYSSLWSSIKQENREIIENSAWLIGSGEQMNFWNDAWCAEPLTQQLIIPSYISDGLQSCVSDYLINDQWNFPPQLVQMFPSISLIVQQVTFPTVLKCDELMWKHTTNGELSLKDAYDFKLQQFQDLAWTKYIWCKEVRPLKSLIALIPYKNIIP